MFHEVAPLVMDLVIEGKMGVTAEKFEPSLKLLKQAKDGCQARTAVMAALGGDGQRRGTTVGTVAKGERNMVAKHHLASLIGERQVLAQPLHLRIRQLARLEIAFLTGKHHIVETHEMLIATVERVVGGTPAVLPLLSV